MIKTKITLEEWKLLDDKQQGRWVFAYQGKAWKVGYVPEKLPSICSMIDYLGDNLTSITRPRPGGSWFVDLTPPSLYQRTFKASELVDALWAACIKKLEG